MPRADRVAAIRALEASRNSRVVCLVLGDRQHLETRMAPDLVPLIGRHLRDIGKQERLDLLLYTTGGDIMSAFRIVGLFREYCDRFAVLVPFRCQSAGTLLALGADEIVMVQESQLSPVDPSINGPYNPTLQIAPPPGSGIQIPTLPVSVEEVVGYIELARTAGRIEGEGMVSVFERLTADVRPMALGQVYRARTQIRMLSRKILQQHMPTDDTAVEGIIEMLTEKLYSHDYLITRREAKQIGLKVVQPDADVEKQIVHLYYLYEADLLLREPFNIAGMMIGKQQATMEIDRALLETVGRADAFRSEGVVTQPQPGVFQPVMRFEGWRSVDD